ncbi:hypothetical protein O6H91_09G080800 [Diphasiastrum complanatum]|uniref:Uncharacterized protein n=1 Tax=Diphasiastrum complanatum TaxID=34168 RepID=A0ACC2CRD1_DIPCM|nr:hypothetical protein O6H91_09G080800 [Diphasiastrum complanatum]
MATALHQTLRNICLKSEWCYAVFWRLKRRSRMVLTWEDGYYDYEKPISASNLASLPLIAGNQISTENDGTNEHHIHGHDGAGVEDQIGLAVAKMSYHDYSLGEGIIGRVAFTGKHQWVIGSREKVHAPKENIYPAGWTSQFTAGIKTIAVVAVPQGVVQLGSTYTIMEDMNLVDHIRMLFGALQNGSTMFISDSPKAQNRMPHNSYIPVPLPMAVSTVSDASSNLLSSQSGQHGLVHVPKAEFSSFWNTSFSMDGNGNSATHYIHKPQFQISEKASKLQSEAVLCHSQAQQRIQPFTSSSLDMANIPSLKSELSGSLSSNSKFSVSLSGHWGVNDFASNVQCMPVDPDNKKNLLCSSLFENLTVLPIMPSSSAITTCIKEPSKNSIHAAEMLAANSPQNSKTLTSSKHPIQQEHLKSDVRLPLTDNAYSNQTAIAPSLLLQFQPSTGSKVDSFGVLATVPTGERQGWEKDNADKNTLSSLFEKDTESTVPLRVDVKDSELNFGGANDMFGTSWLGLDALDDVDVFVASFAKDGSKLLESPPLTHSQHDICDELSEALAPMYRKTFSEDTVEESDKRSNLLRQTSMSETKAEPLLEAVVAGLAHERKSFSLNSNTSSLYQTPASKPHSGPNLQTGSLKSFSSSEMGLSLGGQEESKAAGMLIPFKSFTSGENILGGRACESHTATSSKLHSMQEFTETSTSGHVEEGKSKKSQESVITESLSGKKGEESTKSSKKRVRPGEVSRPRPKDRQQIQDRVRELREIVPNTSKCSIDTLLERTIKHMHFLQTVTQHAGEWKSSGEKEHDKRILGMEQLENGASWALDLGGQGMGCPIVVENLNQPRQLLVEMLCHEKGLFLEIADTIRGLGLTIIKGVMEARSDKIWARFIVEAARDMHRVEVLWSLTQLLQSTTTTSSTVTNQGCLGESQSLDSNSIISMFHQDSLAPLCMHQGLR